MKRSPMPQRTKPMTRTSELSCGSHLGRKVGLKPQSKKRQAENRKRRKVVQVVFGDQPMCSRPGCTRWADDVHEPLTRARGGSITDPANMAPLCRSCHDEVTFTEPAWAYEQGLLKHSWPGDAA